MSFLSSWTFINHPRMDSFVVNVSCNPSLLFISVTATFPSTHICYPLLIKPAIHHQLPHPYTIFLNTTPSSSSYFTSIVYWFSQDDYCSLLLVPFSLLSPLFAICWHPSYYFYYFQTSKSELYISNTMIDNSARFILLISYYWYIFTFSLALLLICWYPYLIYNL